jgi:hypothetical protein
MSVHALLLSVLVTFITVGVSYFYFKNRIGRTEQKVDLMFQLIQEHEKGSQIRQQFQPQRAGGQLTSEAVENMNNSENELIQISEDESDYDSDDSEEVSDTEDKLHISDAEDETDSLVDTVKTISLSLEGAEVSKNINMGEVDVLVEHEFEENVVVKKIDSVEFEEIVDGNDSDKELTEDESVVESAEDEIIDELDLIALSDDEKEPEDYSKMTKDQLKTIAEAKGLTHYKQLKKGALVDLINKAQ